MKTLNISISDIEYKKFGLKADKINFSDFIEIVSNELSRQNLVKCVELAEQYGLSKLTMDEITQEVNAVRENAKNNTCYQCAGVGVNSKKLSSPYRKSTV